MRPFFESGKPMEDEYLVSLRRRRMDLLVERRKLKESADGGSEENWENTCAELKSVTKEMGKLRHSDFKAKRDLLIEELWDAWRQRKMSEAHRLLSRLAFSRHGPRKRYYRSMKCMLPSKDEWT